MLGVFAAGFGQQPAASYLNTEVRIPDAEKRACPDRHRFYILDASQHVDDWFCRKPGYRRATVVLQFDNAANELKYSIPARARTRLATASRSRQPRSVYSGSGGWIPPHLYRRYAQTEPR